MGEGNLFSLSVSSHLGVLPSANGGYLCQVLMGGSTPSADGRVSLLAPDRGVPYHAMMGYPHPSLSGLDGVTPHLDRMGYSPLGLDGVVPTKTGWGYPLLGLDGLHCIGTGWVYPPHKDWMGYPPWSRLDGVPPPSREIRRQNSYVADGMPLAFKQEDFLVSKFSWRTSNVATK